MMITKAPRRIKQVAELLLAGAGLLAASCQTETEPAPDQGQSYYPLELGSYRIYDVADTTFRANVPTVSRFQFREQVDAQMEPDATGQPAYRIIRSRRATPADSWQFDSVFTVTATPKHVLLARNNRRTVELVFPVEEGKVWNLNAFNTLDTIEAENRLYVHVGRPLTVSSNGRQFQYPNTVTTINDVRYDVNAFYATIRRDVFAQGVGPVYRVRRRFTFCSNDPTCVPRPTYIHQGQSRSEILVESGR
ncbi:hypothetical protein [Hymenobacter weizhouensis]|uniref:hypothetical protein n=1 Tax=Hymenobacter sp. YIM 151500-1 TaxID=2987689 RepID=UPI0022274B10|nr:hypothetical protein [Hymenobacter sp. YIM 151500-1]UYZ64108.1 hypothetical protein OIS53_04490 [Hymenobacter sp. YIM 151500-1]